MAFPTTQWSLVLAAGERGDEALATLCSRYWYPVFAFVRRQCGDADEAQDLTQGFFARLIEKGDLGNADRNRGRFRSFLLTSCQHFLSNERDRNRAQKRGGHQIAMPIDIAVAEERYQKAFADEETPQRVYDRQWCLTLLESVLNDVREDYVASHNGQVFDRLRAFLVDSDDYDDAAKDLGMSRGALKVAVHRLRRRYRDALRTRVAETVASAGDVDDEIRVLLGGL